MTPVTNMTFQVTPPILGARDSPLMTIELSTEEAHAFTIFREHQALFEAMISANVHKVQGGSASLHFSPDGSLMEVELKVISYKRKKGI